MNLLKLMSILVSLSLALTSFASSQQEETFFTPDNLLGCYPEDSLDYIVLFIPDYYSLAIYDIKAEQEGRFETEGFKYRPSSKKGLFIGESSEDDSRISFRYNTSVPAESGFYVNKGSYTLRGKTFSVNCAFAGENSEEEILLTTKVLSPKGKVADILSQPEGSVCRLSTDEESNCLWLNYEARSFGSIKTGDYVKNSHNEIKQVQHLFVQGDVLLTDGTLDRISNWSLAK